MSRAVLVAVSLVLALLAAGCATAPPPRQQAPVDAVEPLVRAGRKVENAIAATKLLIERSRTAYLPPSYVARIYAGLGERDKAIAWLEKAYGVRDGHLALVGVEPAFDPLRDDPRFIALLRRLNLAL